MSAERYKSSRTLTAGELILQLSKVDPRTPVVMSQSDEPCGLYGVRGLDIEDMQRDPLYADGHYGMDVFHRSETTFPTRRWNDCYDPPTAVVFLSENLPYQPVIDAEIGLPELEANP
jgi:hypothetical protein